MLGGRRFHGGKSGFVLRRAQRRKAFLERAAPPGRAQRFRAWFERYGLVTVFVPALIPFPMPLKLFVISAGVLGTTARAFLRVMLLARMLRYGGDVWLGVALSETVGRLSGTPRLAIRAGRRGCCFRCCILLVRLERFDPRSSARS